MLKANFEILALNNKLYQYVCQKVQLFTPYQCTREVSYVSKISVVYLISIMCEIIVKEQQKFWTQFFVKNLKFDY